MATYTVTTNSNVVNANDGVTSLREALALANARAGADKIVFASNLAGATIELQGALVLSSDVTINGDTNKDGDADVTISGAGSFSLVTVNSGVTAALTSLVLTNGTTTNNGEGSAIANQGTLTLSYCTISGNVADMRGGGGHGATVVNSGQMTIAESVFSGNAAFGASGFLNINYSAAAAVLNTGALTLDQVAIIGGTAIGGDGGSGQGVNGYAGGDAALGILNRGTMTGTAENDSTGGLAVGGHGGPGAAGYFPGPDGQASLTNLNIFIGSGSITQVVLGTMGANRFTGGNFNGLGGNDVITGNDFSTISGGTGNDRLTGGTGVTANGGLGNDVMVCTFVNGSNFSGGIGRDTIDFRRDNLSGQTIDLSAASFGLFNSTFSSFENAVGSQGSDIIIGSGGVNNLNGFSGDDTINGGGGSDRLIGGAGDDTLTSGSGLDVFVLSKEGINADTITDFVSGTDSLEISLAEFGAGLVAGDLAAARFRANATGLAGDLNDRFIFNTVTGELVFDSNGSAAGGARVIATFSGTSTGLAVSDFDIV